MQPETPTKPWHRLLDRLDAVCREVNAPLTGALPALILAGVLVFGNPGVPDAAATGATCDFSQADGSLAAGPRSRDLLCVERSLERAAEANAGANAERGR